MAATVGVIYCRGHKKGMHKDKHKHPMCIICSHIWKSKINGLYVDIVSWSRESVPTHERGPTPYFWPIFLYKVKVYSNERPLWNELHVEFDMYSLKHYACLR